MVGLNTGPITGNTKKVIWPHVVAFSKKRERGAGVRFAISSGRARAYTIYARELA